MENIATYLRGSVRNLLADKIAAGDYTDIVAIYGPSEAAEGETVDITIRVKNIWSGSLHVYCVGVRDTEDRFIDWLDEWIAAGQSHDFSGSFVMPNHGAYVNGLTYFEALDGYLYLDDEMQVYIKLQELEPTFRSFGVTDYSQK